MIVAEVQRILSTKPTRKIPLRQQGALSVAVLIGMLFMEHLPLWRYARPTNVSASTIQKLTAATDGTWMHLGMGPLLMNGLAAQALQGLPMMKAATRLGGEETTQFVSALVWNALYCIHAVWGTAAPSTRRRCAPSSPWQRWPSRSPTTGLRWGTGSCRLPRFTWHFQHASKSCRTAGASCGEWVSSSRATWCPQAHPTAWGC